MRSFEERVAVVTYDEFVFPETDEKFAELWPEGRRAGLSLTFDDSLESQADVGVPILDAHGVRGTFYALPFTVGTRAGRWEAAARGGHEIGNHTVSHPCGCNFAFSRANALEDFTLARMDEELLDGDAAIEELTGRRPTSFAYPCGQSFVGRGEAVESYVPLVARRFVVGRGYPDGAPNDPLRCDLAQVSGIVADGKDFDVLKEMIDRNLENRTWLVLVSHEVANGPGEQTTTAGVLESVCRYVADLEGLWTDTVSAIGSHLRERRASLRGGE